MGLSSAIRQWQAKLANAYELAALGPDEQGALARDIGVSKGTLARLVMQRAGAGTELPRLMQALFLNADAVERRHPAVMRDMKVVCSECRASSRCRRDLEQGNSLVTYDEYCPNADTLKELRGESYLA